MSVKLPLLVQCWHSRGIRLGIKWLRRSMPFSAFFHYMDSNTDQHFKIGVNLAEIMYANVLNI